MIDIFLVFVRYVLTKLNITEGLFRESIIFLVSSIPFIYFLLNLSKFKIKQWIPFIYIYILVISSILLSIIVNPDLYYFFTRPYYGLSRVIRPDCAIFAFLFFSIADNPENTIKVVIKYAYIYFLVKIIVNLIPALIRGYWIDIGPNGEELASRYNLSFGYAIAFPTMVFLYHFTKDRKVYSLLFFGFGMWCVLTQGNRGSLLIIIIYILLLYIRKLQNSKYSLIKFFFLITFLFLIYIRLDVIMGIALETFHKYGFQSRNIEKLINGSFTTLNGRDFIWSEVIKKIEKIWPLGLGTFGDRPIVAPMHTAGYSHNIFLELIVSYGLIGLLFSIVMIVKVLYMIIYCRDDQWYNLYIIMLSCSAQLLLSMSLWYVWQFWAAISISYKYIKSKKEMKYSVNNKLNKY